MTLNLTQPRLTQEESQCGMVYAELACGLLYGGLLDFSSTARIKYSDQSNLRDKGFVLTYTSREIIREGTELARESIRLKPETRMSHCTPKLGSRD